VALFYYLLWGGVLINVWIFILLMVFIICTVELLVGMEVFGYTIIYLCEHDLKSFCFFLWIPLTERVKKTSNIAQWG
jgi:hypothetical protein